MVGGRKKQIKKNESYYSGGGDKASVTTESIQSALKELRKNIKGTSDDNTDSEVEKKKYYKYFIIGGTLIAIATGIAYYFLIYKKK